MECGSAAIWPSDRVGKHGTLLPPAALILLFQSNMFLSDFGAPTTVCKKKGKNLQINRKNGGALKKFQFTAQTDICNETRLHVLLCLLNVVLYIAV